MLVSQGRIPLQARSDLKLFGRLFHIIMQMVSEEITALSAPMAVEHAKVEDLRVPAGAFCRASLLRRGLGSILRSRSPANSHGEGCPFCERRHFNDACLIGVLIATSGTARDRCAEVVFGTPQRDTHNRRIPNQARWSLDRGRRSVGARIWCRRSTGKLVEGCRRAPRVGVQGRSWQMRDKIIVEISSIRWATMSS